MIDLWIIDLWIVETKDAPPQHKYSVFETEKDALVEMAEGDHLYKIEAENLKFLGTRKWTLEK